MDYTFYAQEAKNLEIDNFKIVVNGDTWDFTLSGSQMTFNNVSADSCYYTGDADPKILSAKKADRKTVAHDIIEGYLEFM